MTGTTKDHLIIRLRRYGDPKEHFITQLDLKDYEDEYGLAEDVARVVAEFYGEFGGYSENES